MFGSVLSTLMVSVVTITLIVARKMSLWAPILGYVLLVVIFLVAVNSL